MTDYQNNNALQRHERESSAFDLLLNSNAVNKLKSINLQITADGFFKLSVSLQIHQDYRWHMVNAQFNEQDDAFSVASELIDTHSSNYEEDEYEMSEWKSKLTNKCLSESNAISLFSGAV